MGESYDENAVCAGVTTPFDAEARLTFVGGATPGVIISTLGSRPIGMTSESETGSQ
jgi:hypothetical protein